MKREKAMRLAPKADNDTVFEPEVAHSMAAALEGVCFALNVSGNVREREILATRIIDLVRCGERDGGRLRERVLREASRATDVMGITL
jgi:hypothetical protein